MTAKPEPDAWDETTWKGSRLRQHREFHALSFSRKLEIIEEMAELAARLRGGAVSKSGGGAQAQRPGTEP